jgi:hypothetical protein
MKTTPILLGLALAAALSAQAPAQAAGATYRCGGIGTDESQQMKAEAANHDMMLTFASSTGAYLADVKVDISNAKGESVAAGNCKGPIMLVDVPEAGEYRITAQYNGVTKQQSMHVGRPGKGAGSTFVWAADVVK